MSKTRKQIRIHDIFGNVIAETAGGGASGATGTVREYIWLPEAEIAPTISSRAFGTTGSRAAVDRPVATVARVTLKAIGPIQPTGCRMPMDLEGEDYLTR